MNQISPAEPFDPPHRDGASVAFDSEGFSSGHFPVPLWGEAVVAGAFPKLSQEKVAAKGIFPMPRGGETTAAAGS